MAASMWPSDSGSGIVHDHHTDSLPPSFAQSDTLNASHSSQLSQLLHDSDSTSPPSQSLYAASDGPPALDSGRPRGNSTTSQASVKRKPLPSSASPLATRFSTPQSALGLQSIDTHVNAPFARSLSGDSPTLYENPLDYSGPLSPQRNQPPPLPQDYLEKQREFTNPNEPTAWTTATFAQPHHRTYAAESSSRGGHDVERRESHSTASTSRHYESVGDASVLSAASLFTESGTGTNSDPPRSDAMSLFPAKQPPPKLTLSLDVPNADETNIRYSNSSSNKALPKSPGARSPGTSKLGSFFGWGGSTSPASSVTSFSEDKEYSPLPSEDLQQNPLSKSASTASGRTIPADIDTSKANDGGYFGDAYPQLPPATPDSTTQTTQVDEMEAELRAISSELATSIRREMDLEDLVERMQSDASGLNSQGKRTSDYFSDSGTSSVRYGGDAEFKAEELDRLQRKTEREKALIRLELNDKVQEERSRRISLEVQIRALEEKASQADMHSMNSADANGRLRELENTCEDLRRRLNEERQVKDNFEDLLTALKSEIQSSQNERDNLRDEIVPSLRARVEGLEAQAAEHEKLTYDNTRMQQEMQSLQAENTRITNERKIQMDMQQMNRFNSIAEEATPPITPQTLGLGRSNTVSNASRVSRFSRPVSLSQSGSRPPSLSRSTSVKSGESRDVLAERVKETEAQRDALHRALKALLERQEHQNRAHESRIKQLEVERDRALTSSPRRMGYDKEVANLREEINTLRLRAEEAIEQKWQCEKGLGGLKMDLERAEQEIGSLRTMLAETSANSPATRLARSNSVTSNALEKAYKDLQAAYSSSLERVRALEVVATADATGAMRNLEDTLNHVKSERDFAVSEADELRAVNGSLRDGEKQYMDSERALADELRTSAKRVEDLAIQVRQQLASNATLRTRLAETIDRGEKEQKSNAARIVFMQGKLKVAEDQVVEAQQITEDRVGKHEDQIKMLKEAHNTQLQRVKDGLKSPRSFGPKSPLSPLFAATSNRLPRLSQTSTGPGLSISEESKTTFLKKRVEELEKALEEADLEMQEVVSRMNTAQIEVMELWNEREEAVKVTKRLEREIEAERKKSFESRFKTMQS